MDLQASSDRHKISFGACISWPERLNSAEAAEFPCSQPILRPGFRTGSTDFLRSKSDGSGHADIPKM